MTNSSAGPENHESDADNAPDNGRDRTPDESGDREDHAAGTGTSGPGIDDSQLPEDLRPGPDNPLASEDEAVSEAPGPGDEAGPEGQAPPGNPSIG